MNNKIELHNIFTTNYTEYAKYTITDRAIPSLEDGCKNIHRRILWSMYVNKNTYDRNRVKANTAVGLCMGYSPHGNTSIYGAMVRFANDSVNLNLIDGKGAFSTKTSRDVDAGADRYVEVRLAPITQEYLKDVDKNIAGMKNNYDETKLEPIYLPVTFPTILCNPNLGIATGIASNICAFPLEDVIDNTINIIDNKEMKLMIPTFSTGGELIYNEKILKQIQDTGTGKLTINSKYEIKDDSIVVTEIPYTTTREVIIEKIIELVKEGKTKSIVDVNDHTGKDGLKITIKTKKNTNMEQLVQYLFKKTTLRDTFSCNFNVLDNNIPKTLGTKDIILKWLEFRKQCIKNRISYDINNKSEKLHLLLGLKKVLLDIDKAIQIIRFSKDVNDELMKFFEIDKIQSDNIINMKLKNINKDYIIKQIKDIEDLQKEVEDLKQNINSVDYINNIIKEDLLRVKKLYSYERKTKIIYNDTSTQTSEDELIEDYNCRIFYTNKYIKKHLKQSDNHKIVEGNTILGDFTTTNKSTLLIFTNKERRYRIQCSDLEQYQPSAFGTFVPKLLGFEDDEEIIKIVSIEKPNGFILIAYEDGNLAKIKIDKYMSSYKKLEKCYSNKSKVLGIYYSEKDVDVLMISDEGKGIIFNSSNFNAVGSTNSQGNVGMKLTEENKVINAIIDINKELNFELETIKGKNKSFMLSDIAPTGKITEERDLYTYLYSNKRGNQGNFLINTRTNEDKVISLIKR